MFSIYDRTRIIGRATAVVLSAAFVTATYAEVIPIGSNFFETVPGLTATFIDFSRDNINRGFFGPGSDPFIGFIRLRGNPIDPSTLGTTDTIMHRPEEINVVQGARRVTADLDLLALELESVNPITVTYNLGNNPEQWDVRVSRQANPPEGGRITIEQTIPDGGTYEAMVNTRLILTFTRRSDGAIRQVPLGLLMGTDNNVPWSFSANPPLFTDGHFCPCCVGGEPRSVVFSGPYLTLTLRPATRLRGVIE
jgi:hypothetical protein